ncbi:MAG TPA: hypothetical protein VFJ85_17890 [Acidimicrobiales bacterium]|nr:hypothetical protein [Acidimicrobiales bacterium]
MFKKMIAAAGIAATLAAGAATLAPTAASADTGYQVATLAPGATFCVRDYVTAYSQGHGEGLVLYGHNVRFTFGTWSPVVRNVYDTGVPVSAFGADAVPSLHPWAFPGRFQVCAINQSLKSSTVQIRAYGI